MNYGDNRGVFYSVSRNGYERNKYHVLEIPHDVLAAIVLNERYNTFVADYADNDDDNKRIPYIGWYWRYVDWFNKRITIGDCREFIGVMENNKWGYPQRRLTEEEFDKVVAIVDAAMTISGKGGNLTELEHATRTELEKLWPLFQTFKIDKSNEYY